MQLQESYLDSYIVLRTLGSGQSATVYLLKDGQGNLFAGKVLANLDICTQDRSLAMLRKEVHILRSLDSDQIVRISGVAEAGELSKEGVTQCCSYLVLEYCEGGELYDYVHDSGRFSEKLTRYYFREIVKAVAVCHSSGVAHCDLKLDNILLNHLYQVKLADFGLAVSLGSDQNGNMDEYRGTPFYMAPEIHSRKPYNGFSVDLFALGVCLFIMFTRTCPFKAASSTDDHYCLFLNDNARYWSLYSHLTHLKIPHEFADLVNSLLALNPTHRLSLSEVMAHPWMQGPIATDVVQQMDVRKANIVRLKRERQKLEADQRAPNRPQQTSHQKQKKAPDYNDLVDELVSKA